MRSGYSLAGLRPRCDVCRQPARVWTQGAATDTARCLRCDELERALREHAATLFLMPWNPTPGDRPS